jgi:3-phytase
MRRAFAIAAAMAATGLSAPGLAQTVEVTATGETTPVGTANDDAADNPVIWRNARRPDASLIVATDKKAGLYVYGLDGQVRHFEAAGRLNNVDLVDLGRRGIWVVASDRNDEANAVLRLYRLDGKTGKLTAAGSTPGGAGEAYGVCLMRSGRDVHAFSVLKHGAIHRVRLDLRGAEPVGTIVQSYALETQTEGCVVDERTATLYVGEEDRGIWAFDLRQAGETTGKLVAAVDGVHLVADVEGLAIAPRGRNGGWLVASSQGDNAYALYRLPDMAPAGRFRIAAGDFGATEETDGIALAIGSFGAKYPQGLFVAQDGDNAPAAQNFKLVSWRAVLDALKKAEKQSAR